MEFDQKHHLKLCSCVVWRRIGGLIWIKSTGHCTFPWGFIAIFQKLQLPESPEVTGLWVAGAHRLTSGPAVSPHLRSSTSCFVFVSYNRIFITRTDLALTATPFPFNHSFKVLGLKVWVTLIYICRGGNCILERKKLDTEQGFVLSSVLL